LLAGLRRRRTQFAPATQNNDAKKYPSAETLNYIITVGRANPSGKPKAAELQARRRPVKQKTLFDIEEDD